MVIRLRFGQTSQLQSMVNLRGPLEDTKHHGARIFPCPTSQPHRLTHEFARLCDGVHAIRRLAGDLKPMVGAGRDRLVAWPGEATTISIKGAGPESKAGRCGYSVFS